MGSERGSQTDQKIGRSCASAGVSKKIQKKRNEIQGKIQGEKSRHTLLLPAKGAKLDEHLYKGVYRGGKKRMLSGRKNKIRKKDLALASKGTEHDEHLVRAQLPLAPAMPTLLYLLLYLLLY